MKYLFNLVDRPWIPCLRQDGSGVSLSLRETLAHAQELRSLTHESPLVPVALIRLILAVIHRALGPRDTTAWAELWQAPAFDMAALNGYLDRCHARFDLFDSERPFYQDASCPIDKAVPVSRLMHASASGNNATLFDHSLDDISVPISPAQAALQLIAHQVFALTGTATPDAAIAGSQFAENAPTTKAALCVCRGENLYRTILLNLRRYDPSLGIPFGGDNDAPAWERVCPVGVRPRAPDGWLDLLTWQTRRILLCPEGDPVAPVVRNVVVMKGSSFSKDFVAQGKDSMFAWRLLQRPQSNSSPWVPVGFRENRAVWREAHCLFGNFKASLRPPIMDWIGELRELALDGTSRFVLDIAGLCTDRSKVLSWHTETLPLPVALVQHPVLWAQVGKALEAAEHAEGALRFGVRRLAECLLLPQERVGEEVVAPDKNATGRLADSLQRTCNYWAGLRLAFEYFVADLSDGVPCSIDHDTGLTPALRAWIGQCRGAAKKTMDLVYRGVGHGARTFKAVAQAENAFIEKLNHDLPDANSIRGGC